MNLIKLFKRYLIFLVKKINIDNHVFKNNTSLDFLCSFYGTDKADKYNDGLGHGYTKYYVGHLDKLKNKKIKFLEIGSTTGASASSFVKFFNKSQAFCADVNLINQIKKSKIYNYKGKSKISDIVFIKKTT